MNKDESILQQLEQAATAQGILDHSRESIDWFRKKALNVSRSAARESVLKDQHKRTPSKARDMIGHMFVYAYDAKHKDTLPYFDALPLIFMIGPTTKGDWCGINLHYIPPRLRAVLMDKLMDITNNKRYNNTTRIQLSYDLLNASKDLKFLKAGYKAYLSSQLRSRMSHIPAGEWRSACMLPIADFQGSTNSKVWKDSLSKF